MNAVKPGFHCRSTHIWSPPVLQDSVRTLTGTGLLPYIRPVDEELSCSSGLDEIGAYRPNQPSGLRQPLGLTGFQYAGLTCGVINVHIVFAIVGRSTSLTQTPSLITPRGARLGRPIHRFMAQQRPAHARQLIGQRHGGLVGAAPLTHAVDPAAQGILLVLGMQHHAARAVDQ